MHDEWPKLVTGKCTRCGEVGNDFQLAETPIICGNCKVEIGKKAVDNFWGIHEFASGIRNLNKRTDKR